MASIVSEMFSATAVVAVVSAINLSNSFTNLMLSKLISRRNSLARLSVLENSAITRCRHKSFKKRPRKKKRFWIKPGRTDLWWRNMKEDRCLEEDWKKNFRMSKAEFLKLVDELRPFISPNPRSPRPGFQQKRRSVIQNSEDLLLKCVHLYLSILWLPTMQM